MPIVHRYVDGRGHYIKSSIKGSIVTYQVTAQGENYLRRNNQGNHSDISPRQLQYMIKRCMVYTGGAGPGTIGPAGKIYQQPKDGIQEILDSCGCCSALVLILLLVPFLLLVWQRRILQ